MRLLDQDVSRSLASQIMVFTGHEVSMSKGFQVMRAPGCRASTSRISSAIGFQVIGFSGQEIYIPWCL